MSTFTRLILFDFLSEIYIRNSLIFILLNYEFKFVMFSFLLGKQSTYIASGPEKVNENFRYCCICTY